MHLVTLARYLLTAGAILGVFTVLGAPWKLLAGKLARQRLAVPAPIFGMAVATVGGWYWYGAVGGIRSFVWIACAVSAVILLAVAVATRHRWRANGRELARRMVPVSAISAGVVMVFTMALGGVLSLGYMTVATNGNSDVAAYAQVAQHLRDSSPDDPGPAENGDIGNRARLPLDFGAAAVLAAASSLGPYGDVWRYLLAMIAVASGLCAYTLYLLLDTLLASRRLLVGCISVAGITPLLFAYLWSEYFLNQLLAIGLVFALCSALVSSATAQTRRLALTTAVAGGAPLAVLAASYPHMAIIGPAIILPAMIVTAGRHGFLRRVARTVLAGLIGVAITTVALPGIVTQVPTTIRQFGSIPVGYPLPGFLPLDILGFTATVRPKHTPADWIPSIVLLVVVVAACVWLIVSRSAPAVGRFSLVAVAGTLTGYWVTYESQNGPSYRQWKWITFFVPFFAAAVLLALLVTVEVFLRRFEPLGTQVAVGATVAFSALALSTANAVTFPAAPLQKPYMLRLDDIDLERNPQLTGIDHLNVDVSNGWQTMWAAYFLRAKHLRLVQWSYYPTAAPQPGWTLMLKSAELPPTCSKSAT